MNEYLDKAGLTAYDTKLKLYIGSIVNDISGTSIAVEILNNQNANISPSVTITYTYESQTITDTQSGSEVVFEDIPAGVEYTISFGTVSGYSTPSSVTGTAPNFGRVGYNVTYNSELVTVNTVTTGATLYIDGIEYTQPINIAYGTTYTVSGSSVSGYTTESQTFTAGLASRIVTIIYTEIQDGVFAVTTSGDLVEYADINTSNTSLYVGVAIIDSTNDFSFFIDKRLPTGSAANTTVGNYKAWSVALYNTDQSYLTSISTSTGDGNSIASAAPTATREAALAAYANGETGIVNTNYLVADTTASSETAANNAAKYCRSIANPVTGAYDGYLGSLAEWIAVNDNLVEVNQILTAIGGVAFASTNSGYSSSGTTYTRYRTSSECSSSFAWSWLWYSSDSFAYFNYVDKSNGYKDNCARPFFPLS